MFTSLRFLDINSKFGAVTQVDSQLPSPVARAQPDDSP